MSVTLSFNGAPSYMVDLECHCVEGTKVRLDCTWCKGTGVWQCRESDYEVNMANGNFHHMMVQVLGLDLGEDWYYGSMHPEKLLKAIASCLARQVPETGERPTTVTGGNGKATIIDCGVDAEYISQRLGQLKKIAEKARKLGEKISWG